MNVLQKNMKEWISATGLTNITSFNFKRINVDGWPGCLIESVASIQRLDFVLSTYQRIYFAIYKNSMIALTCQVWERPQDEKKDFKERISKFNPLFDLIANSLIIHGKF